MLNPGVSNLLTFTAGATFPFGPRCCSESFPIGQAQIKSGSPPHVESAFFCNLAGDHGSLINSRPIGIGSAEVV